MDFKKLYIENKHFRPLVKSTPQLREKLRELEQGNVEIAKRLLER